MDYFVDGFFNGPRVGTSASTVVLGGHRRVNLLDYFVEFVFVTPLSCGGRGFLGQALSRYNASRVRRRWSNVHLNEPILRRYLLHIARSGRMVRTTVCVLAMAVFIPARLPHTS